MIGLRDADVAREIFLPVGDVQRARVVGPDRPLYRRVAGGAGEEPVGREAAIVRSAGCQTDVVL